LKSRVPPGDRSQEEKGKEDGKCTGGIRERAGSGRSQVGQKPEQGFLGTGNGKFGQPCPLHHTL